MNGKIHTPAQLLSFRDACRRDGKTVVHCHGCFDIVHPGHVQHLQFARSLGDVLIVTVTADAYVGKGVARPLIPQELRAQNLAAFVCVDGVMINDAPTALDLLRALKPDIFIKGGEYERSDDPRFLEEKQAVIDGGGRVVFSGGEVVYSSTALIRHLGGQHSFEEQKLTAVRQRYGLADDVLGKLVRRFEGLKVVVAGDYILDRYHNCEAVGVAGEGPMMSLRPIERLDFDGGAGVVARHVTAMGAKATLVTCLADDADASAAALRLRSEGVEVISPAARRQTVVKHRYLADGQKLFKVDEGGFDPLDTAAADATAAAILQAAEGADAVIFTDFGCGMLTAAVIDRVLPILRKTNKVLAADVSGGRSDLLRFRGMDLLCPNERELRDTLHDSAGGIGALVSRLLRETQSKRAMVTLGKQGVVCCDWPGGDADAAGGRLRTEHLPALPVHAVDSLGCGDSLLAAATLTLAAGGSLAAAALVGSAAAAQQVEHSGNVPVSADEILSRLASGPMPMHGTLSAGPLASPLSAIAAG